VIPTYKKKLQKKKKKKDHLTIVFSVLSK
jgi:hypothetical protein